MSVYATKILLMFYRHSYQCVFPGENNQTRMRAARFYPIPDAIL